MSTLALLMAMGATTPEEAPRSDFILPKDRREEERTPADLARLKAAQEKRERRAAKRRKA